MTVLKSVALTVLEDCSVSVKRDTIRKVNIAEECTTYIVQTAHFDLDCTLHYVCKLMIYHSFSHRESALSHAK